ncbi:receptor-like kinase tmk3 [Quercus suber]|uniref:Receptor-like kinase tmk3 n=1 Tax=Quercus suber TaxID=58331 RepID=A0AAW0LCX5_QUESU
MSISQNYLSKVGMQKHRDDLGFFGNNSDPGSLIDSEGRSESLIESVSIPSLFLANKSDTDGSSESNEISPIFTHYPNSIVSFFSPARSSSVSENHYEIIFPNPSIPTNGPTSLSISLLFPPTMSETETYGSSSESNETQFSYSIMSFFPPARSQSDISKNFTMISTDPSISASPIHTTETATFLKYLTLQVLLEATNNFSEDHKIRTSSFGSAYRSTLDDGREVAIKRAEISMSKPYVLDPKVPPPTLFEKEALAYVGSLAEDCVSKEGRNWYEEAYNDQDCKRPTKSLRGVCGCGW